MVLLIKNNGKKNLLDLLGKSGECFTIKIFLIGCPGLAKIIFPSISIRGFSTRKIKVHGKNAQICS